MHEIKVPRESANDNEVLISEINYKNGDWVLEGSVIASVEGEKAVYDVLSDKSGYIYFYGKVSAQISIEMPIAIVSEDLIDNFDYESDQFDAEDRRLEVDSSYGKTKVSISPMSGNLDETVRRVAVIGAGKGLDQILDAAKSSNKYNITVAYDDIKFGKTLSCVGVPIVGPIDVEKIKLDYLDGLFDAIVISVSTNIRFRKECFDVLSRYIPFINVVHKSAVISPDSIIGAGNVILANVVIGSKARLGNNNFISALCNIEHHCIVGSHCTFGPSVVFSGGVEVCDEVKFGTGIFVEPFYKFSQKKFIKSGSVLVDD